jgi:hypothetical protein
VGGGADVRGTRGADDITLLDPDGRSSRRLALPEDPMRPAGEMA